MGSLRGVATLPFLFDRSWLNFLQGADSLLVPADQVEQREQEDPDDVDKCQYKPKFSTRSHARGVCPGSSSEDMNPRIACNDHVQGVHTGHGEVQREVTFRCGAPYRPSAACRGTP